MVLRKHLFWGLVGLSLTTLLVCFTTLASAADQVVVETQNEGKGDPVVTDYRYSSHVTLYLDDEKQTPSGWSTRKEHGAAADKPFVFQPGVNLIKGWTEGVLRMKEGERALLHVPASLGYGERPMGQPGGAFYIPANSDLLFDIEILGKDGEDEL